MARPKAHGNAQTIASLNDENAATPPVPSMGAGTGFGGAPTLSSNPIDSGERSIAAAMNGGADAMVYGGGAAVVKQRSPRRVSGSSGSGAVGAVDGSSALPR